MAKRPATIKSKQTKSQILSDISEHTGFSKKDVVTVLESMSDLAVRHLKKGGSGEFNIPALGVKLRRVIKPARSARPGVNPFTGEKIMLKAKPETTSVRARPLKAIKDAIS